MKKKRKKRKATNPTGKTSPPFPKEFKLRMVRLYLEEGYQASLLARGRSAWKEQWKSLNTTYSAI